MNESKAARYQRGRRRARVAGVALGGAVLLALALERPDAGLAGWASRIGWAWPGPAGAAVALAAYALGGALLWRVAAVVAFGLIGSRPGDAPQARGRLSGQWQAAALAAAVAWAAGAAVLIAAWTAGPWWWALCGALAAVGLVAALHAGPGLIARASGARPVPRPALVERLGALSRQVHVEIASVDALPASATVTSTALVAGAGAARRVFIADEVLRDWSDEEIAVVVAHEFAHHAHHDLWSTLALDLALLMGGLWAASGALRAAGVAADGVPATLPALPAVALVAGAVWLLATPVRHAWSRRQERRADVFALTLTGAGDAFQAAIRRLAARHLAEDRPSRLTRWFFHRHPTPAERLQLAERFSGQTVPKR
jgi:STE24 endopeptidase